MRKLCIIGVTFIFLLACHDGRNHASEEGQPMTEEQMEEQLIELNRQLLNQGEESIDTFVAEKGWPMTIAESGLRYWVYEPRDTLRVSADRSVKINYTVDLLDGTRCYSSDESGPKSFKIGHANVAPGLHEAVTLMGLHEKALFVFPSHLAWGLSGDNDKVPSGAALVYDIELIEVW